MVECNTLAPPLFAVALLTLAAKLALVRILRCMTGVALAAQRLLVETAAMAAVARQLLVATAQCEWGIAGVIEPTLPPAALTVAATALTAVARLVNVFAAMTIDAGITQFDLKLSLPMTAVAARLRMPALQRKSGFTPVVETRTFPVVLLMALLAVAAAAAVVNIVDRVAFDTALRCAGITLGRMTAGTTYLLMRTL